MAEGSGSEASSVPSGPAAAPTVAAPPTATVSYAKIAAVTSDNDPAAAVIVVNPEVAVSDSAAADAAKSTETVGEYQQEEKRQPRGKKGKGGAGGAGERAHRKEKGAKKKMMQVHNY